MSFRHVYTVPDYYPNFRCKTGDCRHPCCIGWDIAITPTGPAIIEGNEYPGTDLCQVAPHYPEKVGLWPYYKEILSL